MGRTTATRGGAIGGRDHSAEAARTAGRCRGGGQVRRRTADLARAPRRRRRAGRRLLGIADHARGRCTSARCWATPRTCCRDGRPPDSAATCCAASTPPGAARRWLADIRRADCQILLTDAEHRAPARRARPAGVRVLDVAADEWADLLAAGAGELAPHREVGAMDTFMMIFTSGTSGEPKAVQVPHLMVLFSGPTWSSGSRSPPTTSATSRCRCSTPTRCVAGWAVALGSGAAMVPAQFSASRFLDGRAPLRRDVHELRRQAARLRAGHPRAARRRRQPAAGRLRQRGERPRHRGVRRAVRLHGDGRLRLDRARGHHHPRRRHARRARSARASPASAIYDPETLTECAVAEFDDDGALLNADEAIGELVNTAGRRLLPAATTTTRPPTTSGCGTACTGPATSPTATPTAGSTSPAAPPTGCASTARTSPRPRSSGSCSGCPRSARSRCTPCPTSTSATR